MANMGRDILNIYGAKGAANAAKVHHRDAHPKSHENEEQHEAAGGEGEGTWIFSFADLITNLLMFFVMMFAISSVDTAKLQSVSNAISGTNNSKKSGGGGVSNVSGKGNDLKSGNGSPVIPRRGTRELLSEAQTLLDYVDQKSLAKKRNEKESLQKLRKRLTELSKIEDAQQVNRWQSAFGITMPLERLFDGTVRLSAPGKELLAELAHDLQKFLTPLVVSIETHTGRERGGPGILEPLALTAKRSGAIAAALRGAGLTKPHKIVLAAMGNQENLIEGETSVNERIIIRVAPDTETDYINAPRELQEKLP